MASKLALHVFIDIKFKIQMPLQSGPSWSHSNVGNKTPARSLSNLCNNYFNVLEPKSLKEVIINFLYQRLKKAM